MKRTFLVLICAAAFIMFAMIALAQKSDKTVVVTPEGVKVEGNQKPSLASRDYGDNSQVFVPTVQPIFLRGKKLVPTEGGHSVTISKENGIHVDGQLYLSMIKPVIDEPAKIEDGFFHFIIDRSMRIKLEAYGQGEKREQVREHLINFWAQYLDSLTVESHERGFFLTYQGRTLSVSERRPSLPKMPDQQIEDYFSNCLLPSFKSLLMYLEAGNLVICGQNYMNAIDPDDVDEAMAVLNQLSDRAQVAFRIGDQIEYHPIELLDGKYLLTTSVIKDFLSGK